MNEDHAGSDVDNHDGGDDNSSSDIRVQQRSPMRNTSFTIAVEDALYCLEVQFPVHVRDREPITKRQPEERDTK